MMALLTRVRDWRVALARTLAVLAAAAFACAPAFALSTDRDQPLNIEADSAEADNARRVTIYKGDVVITQGTLRIRGDTVTAYYDEAFDLTRLISVGRPASFRQLPDGETDYRTAKARRMEYYAGEDLIILLGDARYGKGADRVSADRIIYDSLNARVKAETDPSLATTEPDSEGSTSTGRVKITIVPKKKTSTE